MSALMRYYRGRHERYLAMLKWRGQLPALKRAVEEAAPGAATYVFGSALRDELTANSDVDVLVVVGRHMGPMERARLAVKVEEGLPEPGIFELHVSDQDGYRWYRRHAKEMVPLSRAMAPRPHPAKVSYPRLKPVGFPLP